MTPRCTARRRDPLLAVVAFALILGSTVTAGLRVLGIRWLLPTAANRGTRPHGCRPGAVLALRRDRRYLVRTTAATRVPRVEGDLELAAQERDALAHAAEAETGVQHLRIEPTAIVVDHHVQRAAVVVDRYAPTALARACPVCCASSLA